MLYTKPAGAEAQGGPLRGTGLLGRLSSGLWGGPWSPTVKEELSERSR